MWSGDYHVPAAHSTSLGGGAAPAQGPLPPELATSTPLRPLMTSSFHPVPDSPKLPEPSLIDRYKSESNIYQLSYLDDDVGDSDDEKSAQSKNPSPEKKTAKDTAATTEEPRPLRPESPTDTAPVENPPAPLDAIHHLIEEIGDTPALEAVPHLIEVLNEGYADGAGDAVSLPYPPVDEFTLQLLDYRLGKRGLPMAEGPQPALPTKYERLAVAKPLDSLSLDEEMEIICKNELPELPYEPTGDGKSPSHKFGGGIGKSMLLIT